MLTIGRAYDPHYLTKEVAQGAENYYLRAVGDGVRGEPAGIWTGRGCPELGLDGEVENAVFEALVEHYRDPRDPAFHDPDVPEDEKAHLGRPDRNYVDKDELYERWVAAEPDASQERRKELWIDAKKKGRKALKGLDLTYSPPKSVTLLHASLQMRAQQSVVRGELADAQMWSRRAELVWDAVMAGNEAMLEYMQDEAGQSRSRYHGKAVAGRSTGLYPGAKNWIIASFRQHTNRNEDPQLHVHNFVLNRVLTDEGEWRTLDSKAIHKARAAGGAVGERVMWERLTATLGVQPRQRPDGHGMEVAGVDQAVMDLHSSRATQVRDGVQELVDAYEAQHGRAPSAAALFSMGQFVQKDTKVRKKKLPEAPTRAELLAAWEDHTRESIGESLADLPESTLGRVSPERLAERVAAGYDVEQVIDAALAEVQAKRAVWDRSQLIQALNNHLPPTLGGLDRAHVRALLDELADRAVAPAGERVKLLTAPEVVATPAALQRADGSSLYEPLHSERWSTGEHLDREGGLLAAARGVGGRRLSPIRAATLLGLDLPEPTVPAVEPTAPAGVGGPIEAAGHDGAAAAAPYGPAPAGAADSGSGVGDSSRGADHSGGASSTPRAYAMGLSEAQARAAYGILTDERGLIVLSAPAGAGKSHLMGAVDTLWRGQTGGRTIGLTTSQNAAFVLGGEGLTEAHNIAHFLVQVSKGKARLDTSDLLIVDEASMVSTGELDALRRLAERAGAKLLLTGDPEQLDAPEAGGMMRQIVNDVGAYELHDVVRFREQWERDASARLRTGDATALEDYDRRGRLRDGTSEQMQEAAYEAWLADHLNGRDSLLLTATTDQATTLSARARARLVELGRVEADGVALRDRNTAGVGDIIQTRRNNRRIADAGGRMVANRDVFRVVERDEHGGMVVERVSGSPEERRRRVRLPSGYVARHVELAYASTVHASQGRTVDTCHAVIDETVNRSLAYVAITRGRLRNALYAITDRHGVADLSPAAAPAPAVDPEQQRTAEEVGRDRFDVLAEVFGRPAAEPTATETIREEQQRTTHLAHLGPIWVDRVRQDQAAVVDAVLGEELTGDELAKMQADGDSFGPLLAVLREAQLAGLDSSELLRASIRERALIGDGTHDADSIGKTLHWRVTQHVNQRREWLAEHPDEAQRVADAAASWAGRTPELADPEMRRFVGELAEQMDARTAELGEQTAAAPPSWALDHLGPVPADPAAAAEWQQRAGRVAAFVEQFRPDNEDVEHDPLGLDPGPGNPEARAARRLAHQALGMPDDRAEVHGMRDGALWLDRARYMRAQQWAPAYVADELRDAHLAMRDSETRAALLSAQARAAGNEAEREGLFAQARREARLAEAAGARVAALTEINDARERWVKETVGMRARAEEVGEELRRRVPRSRWQHTGADLPSLAETPADRAERDRLAAEQEQRGAIAGQLEIDFGRAVEQQQRLDLHAETGEMRESLRRRLTGWLRRDRTDEVTADQVTAAAGADESPRIQRAAAPVDEHQADAPERPHVPVEGQEELDLGIAATDVDAELRGAVERARHAQQVLDQREQQRQRARADQEREESHDAQRARERRGREAGAERRADREREHPARVAGRDLPKESQQALDNARRAEPTRRRDEQQRQDAQQHQPPAPKPPRRDGPGMSR